MIVLGSDLSLARETSFSRQLRLLAQALAAAGRRCLLVGTGEPRRFDGASLDLPRITASALAAAASAAGEAVDAVILLGYADRFPLRTESGPPLYLWAQCSRPPAAGALGRAIAVPLTERTRAFLEQAGCPAIGPTIPHGVDTGLFRPPGEGERRRARAELGIEGGTLVVGTVGANTTRKRFDRLIAAFASLARSPALLLVKTDRERAAGGFDLPALASRCGVCGRVRALCEPLDAASLARLYAAMDIYAHAAEWEGFAVPVAEAMACGLPVAAADTQGPGEIIPYRDTLVAEGDWIDEGGSRLFRVAPPALAAAIDRLAADAALRERLGRRGRDEALRRFEARVVAARWLALLEGGAARRVPPAQGHDPPGFSR